MYTPQGKDLAGKFAAQSRAQQTNSLGPGYSVVTESYFMNAWGPTPM